LLNSGKPAPPDGLVHLFEEVIATSSTVEQAQQLLGRYSLDGLQTSQLFFGDRFGHSLIIDGDTVLPIEGKYQVAANFRQAEYPAPPYPSDRYNLAASMLAENASYSVDLFRQILDAVHQEGDFPTQYSQVYDLKNGLIYLYQFHDFEHVVVINIAEELAKGPHSAAIASLFPKNEDRERFAFQPLLQYQVNADSQADENYDPSRLADFTGEYRDPAQTGGQGTRVTLSDGSLYIQKEGMPAARLYPVGGDAFLHPYFYPRTETRIQFQRDLFGQVTGLDGVFQIVEFGIRQPYHLEKTGVSHIPYGWIVMVLGAVVILAFGGWFIWRKRRDG
jgi:hypothetical protein